MSPAQQALDYQREIDENQKQVREMVMESYHDIAAGKGRDCNDMVRGFKKVINSLSLFPQSHELDEDEDNLDNQSF
ncbi:MAG: hypothetical protein K2H52_12595 [Lachnospiraceae bacterium]|nr:hypothetical protein [Lachnospiraceae bacterium]MDE6186462.1 hypothetical protein [Lachnospiraceae bacterium]